MMNCFLGYLAQRANFLQSIYKKLNNWVDTFAKGLGEDAVFSHPSLSMTCDAPYLGWWASLAGNPRSTSPADARDH